MVEAEKIRLVVSNGNGLQASIGAACGLTSCTMPILAAADPTLNTKDAMFLAKATRDARCGIPLAISLSLLAATTPAAPLLRCLIEQGGVAQTLEFAPVVDPYTVKAVDIGDHFRFKALVLGTPQQVESIKLYSYYQTKRQPVLLQQVVYQAPVAQVAPTPYALTGLNLLYSPQLERELRYGCALLEVSP